VEVPAVAVVAAGFAGALAVVAGPGVQPALEEEFVGFVGFVGSLLRREAALTQNP